MAGVLEAAAHLIHVPFSNLILLAEILSIPGFKKNGSPSKNSLTFSTIPVAVDYLFAQMKIFLSLWNIAYHVINAPIVVVLEV